MKCYDLNNCSPEKRAACFVYAGFSHNLQDMENIACWILKKSCGDGSGDMSQSCYKCPYYIKMNANNISAQNGDYDTLVIRCSGVLNNSRAGIIGSIANRLSSLKRKRLILDLSAVNNIYSIAIGQIIKLHLECKKFGGELVISGARGYVQDSIEASKLNRILTVVETIEDAVDFFCSSDNETKLIERVVMKPEDPAPELIEEAEPLEAKPKPCANKKPRCFEYFKNHNPANATGCNNCAQRKCHSGKPCWMIESVSGGVTISYVNEDCCCCRYYSEHGES